MAKMIQIRHVPDSLHRRLRTKASRAGMSLSDYLRTTLETVARQLSPDELRERLAELDPVELPEGESAAEIIREMRGSI